MLKIIQVMKNYNYILVFAAGAILSFTSCKNDDDSTPSVENTYALCTDGKDNDGNGKTDCDDPQCQQFSVCQTPEATCTDKKQNGNETGVDCGGDCKPCAVDTAAVVKEKVGEAKTTYASVVLANYQDSYDSAVKLKDLIHKFVANPTQAAFDACKSQWKVARVPYGQTEAFRFANGPIDTGDDAVEGLLNAWPMDENFVDYVKGNMDAGIINDLTAFPALTKEIIAAQNENGGEANVSTGWHAIEFLLWGQDLYTDSAGRRPYTDYVTGANGTAKNQDRRGTYLKAVADLLVEDLAKVKAEWEASGAYLATFKAFDNKTVVENVFKSLTELSKGELAGERMAVALKSQDQEDEHSCFADNTHVDIAQNFEGMVNVYTGTYTKMDGTILSGTSFADVAMVADATKAEKVKNAIVIARAKIAEIPTPFDQAILNNTAEIEAAVVALENLSDAWADVKVSIDANL